jgi:hypothetical protein
LELTSSAHRYRAGDRVVFHSEAMLPQFEGLYLIERLLPISDGGSRE